MTKKHSSKLLPGSLITSGVLESNDEISLLMIVTQPIPPLGSAFIAYYLSFVIFSEDTNRNCHLGSVDTNVAYDSDDSC